MKLADAIIFEQEKLEFLAGASKSGGKNDGTNAVTKKVLAKTVSGNKASVTKKS